jgi:hypothetical protein
MNTIEHATGRTYDAPQVLQITIEQQSADEWGIVDFTATFIDTSRHISGRVQSIAFAPDRIGQSVLAAYDAGNYSPL